MVPQSSPPRAAAPATSGLAYFQPVVQDALVRAEQQAQALHLDFVETEHVLAALCVSPDPSVREVFARLAVDPEQLRGYLMNYMEPSQATGETSPAFSLQVKQVLSAAVEEAQRALLQEAGPLQLVIGLARVPEGKAAHALARYQVTTSSLSSLAAPEPQPQAATAVPPFPTHTPAPAPAQQPAAAPQSSSVPSGVLANFTTAATEILSKAGKVALDRRLTVLEPEHVLLTLLQDPGVSQLLANQKADAAALAESLALKMEAGTREIPTLAPSFSPRTRRLLENADMEAKAMGAIGVAPLHLLLALTHLDGLAADTLAGAGIRYEILRADAPGVAAASASAPGAELAKDSFIARFGEDLTEKARQGKLDVVIGRQHEIEKCVSILSRRLKNNPVILGEAGVGKTALAEGLAQLIVGPGCPEVLRGKRIVSISLTSIVSGASHRGEFEERMEGLIKEVQATNGEVIVFIDEIHNLLGAGGDGSMNAANILKPALSRGELRMIGATTLSEYKKYMEKDPALQRRFQKVVVEPPSVEATIEILKGLRAKYEAFHQVTFPDSTLESAARLSDRYIHERFLPDKAVDLMDEAAAQKHLPALSIPQDIDDLNKKAGRLEGEVATLASLGAETRAKKKQRELDDTRRRVTDLQQQLIERSDANTHPEVSEEDVMRVVANWTGIPISHLRESEAEKLLHMEERLRERVIGQEDVKVRIAEAVRRGKAGLKNPNQPIGSFIFLGPTGVGKTELAKAVAEFLFGSEQALVRFDMSEFQEKHAVARLIGSPPGYVGYDEGGQLTEAVRARPYCVLLFDEIEKAHPDIFDIFLQLLDDGRLTDTQGRTVDFKNTIVICTSNIGSHDIQQKLGLLTAPAALDAPVADSADAPADAAAPVDAATPNTEQPTPVTPSSPFAPEAPKLAPLPAEAQGGILDPAAVAAIQQEQVAAKETSDERVASGDQEAPAAEAAPAAGNAAPADAAAPVVDAAAPAEAATPNTEHPTPTDDVDAETEDPRRKAVLKELRKVIRDDLQKFMRPEMVNRFDEICIFEPLTLRQITKIVSLILAGTQERLAEQGLYLEVEPEVKELLAQRGYDPAFGARPLKRVIQRDVDNVLASHLIRGEFTKKDVILATIDNAEVVFRKKQVDPAPQAQPAAAETAPAPAAAPVDPAAAVPAVPGLQADQNPAFVSELPPREGQAAPLEGEPAHFPSENPPRTAADWQ